MSKVVNILVSVAVACLAADVIYEMNKKHDLTGKVKAKFSK